MSEIEVKPSLPSHEAPGVARQKAEGGPQEKVPVPSVSGSACPPAWWQHEEESSDILYGKGESQESLKKAESNAREAIAKAIEVSISGEDTFVAVETSNKGYEYSVRSKIVERVKLSLAGISITKSEVGKCGKQWYARAKLDLKKAKRAWRLDMKDFDNKAAGLRKSIKDKQNKDALMLLSEMRELEEVAETGNQIKKRLQHWPDGKEVPAKFDMTAIRQDIQKLIRSFRGKALRGDNQRAVEQPDLPDPFVMQVLASGDPPIPVAGVPVEFTVVKGDIELRTADTKTGLDGKAKAEGRHSSHAEVAAQVKATVQLDQMEGHYPDQLKGLVRQQQEHLTVRFHVRPPVYHLVTDMERLAGEANMLRSGIRTARVKGDVRSVMEGLSQLHEVQMKRDQVAQRLRALHYPAVEAAAWSREPALRALKRLASSFEFRMVNGDDQKAVFDRPLRKPLEVRLVAALYGKTVPVSGVKVDFQFEQGKGEIASPFVSTDEDGLARATVRRVEHAESANDTEAVITARLNVADFAKLLPGQVSKQFRRHAGERVTRFRIDVPYACASSDRFDDKLYKLACELVKKVHDSAGKDTVVHNFVELQSKKRYPQVSDRIEKALRDGLALTRELKVRLPSQASGSASVSRDLNGMVEVSGYYERGQGNLLKVDAKLRRISEKHHYLEALGTAKIPLSSVSQNLLASLPPPAHDSPLVPDPSAFKTHDEWIEVFWHHHNPEQEFRTWIKPKKSVYQDQENAVFSFKTERDCYLRVFAIDVAGTGAVLLPNTYRRDLRQTLVRADEGWVSIPGPADQFTLPISPPFGGERIKTICTTRATPLVSQASIPRSRSPITGVYLFLATINGSVT